MADLSDETIAEVSRLAAAGVGRNEIARRLGISAGSVTAHAPAGSFDRTATAEAVKARQVDMAGRRAALADDLLSDAERLRAQLWEPTIVYSFGGKENTYNEHPVTEPPFDAKRNIMQTVATAVTQHMRLEQFNLGDGHQDAREAILSFGNAIREMVRDEPTPPA